MRLMLGSLLAFVPVVCWGNLIAGPDCPTPANSPASVVVNYRISSACEPVDVEFEPPNPSASVQAAAICAVRWAPPVHSDNGTPPISADAYKALVELERAANPARVHERNVDVRIDDVEARVTCYFDRDWNETSAEVTTRGDATGLTVTPITNFDSVPRQTRRVQFTVTTDRAESESE